MKKTLVSAFLTALTLTPFSTNLFGATSPDAACFPETLVTEVQFSGTVFSNTTDGSASISPVIFNSQFSTIQFVLGVVGSIWNQDRQRNEMLYALTANVNGAPLDDVNQVSLLIGGDDKFTFQNTTDQLVISSPAPLTIKINLTYSESTGATSTGAFTLTSDALAASPISSVVYRGPKVALIAADGREKEINFSLASSSLVYRGPKVAIVAPGGAEQEVDFSLATSSIVYRGDKVALVGPGNEEQLLDFSLTGVSDANLKKLMHLIAGLSSKKISYTRTPADAVTLQITIN